MLLDAVTRATLGQSRPWPGFRPQVPGHRSELVAAAYPSRPTIGVVHGPIHGSRPEPRRPGYRVGSMRLGAATDLETAISPERSRCVEIVQLGVIGQQGEVLGPQGAAELARQDPFRIHDRAGELRVMRP
jgi:hypothetical protein